MLISSYNPVDYEKVIYYPHPIFSYINHNGSEWIGD